MTDALRIYPETAAPCLDHATPAPALMTSADLAGEIQVSERTVRRLEITGKIGPRPIHIGRAVRYRRDEVTQWIEAGCPDRATWQDKKGKGRTRVAAER